MHLQVLAIWGDIWKCTVEKSQTNAASVTMHLLEQVIWGNIWKRTVEKSQTNATNVNMHPLRQAIWGDIWKRTVEEVKNATSEIAQAFLKLFDNMHKLKQLIWLWQFETSQNWPNIVLCRCCDETAKLWKPLQCKYIYHNQLKSRLLSVLFLYPQAGSTNKHVISLCVISCARHVHAHLKRTLWDSLDCVSNRKYDHLL